MNFSNYQGLEEILKIDNKIETDNLTINKLQKYFDEDHKVIPISKKKNNLIITEGNPYLTIDILKSLFYTKNKTILYINGNYVATNMWLVKVISDLFEIDVELDTSSSYDHLLNTTLNVIPIGEKHLVEQVKMDFDLK